MREENNSSEDIQGNIVYKTLLEEIRSGQLKPSDRLREVEIAKRLGVSRTPIREAIRQLEAEGLVVHIPRQGAAIRKLEYVEVMELYEIRAVLEGASAKLAARMISEAELAKLYEMNQELARLGNAVEAFQVNQSFHNLLNHAARNRFLNKAMIGFKNALLILGPTTLSDAERAESAIKEHEAILDAIQKHDGDLAENLMRKHIEAGQRARIRSLFEEENEA